jgi:hypothetical protein
MAMPMPGPATPPAMRMGPPGPPMTQPPFPQGYPPPPKRSKAPVIAAVGCGGLVLLAVVIFAVSVIVAAAKGPTTTDYTPPPYSFSPPPLTNPDGIPADLGGTWTGSIVSSSDSSKTWDAKIVLFEGLSTGSVSYTGTTKTCSGLLTLQDSTSDKTTLKETITIGRSDCSDGYVQLYPGSSSVRYEWRGAISDTTPSWSGTLTNE